LKALNFKLKIKNYKSGFTLIELLVAIALISILGASIMTLIDPLEQIRRGNDTANQTDAKQLLDAVNRFYANNGYYPWQSGASDLSNLTLKPVAVGNSWVCGACTPANKPVLTILSDNTSGGQEIQAGLVNKVSSSSYNKLYIYNGSTSSNPNMSTYICFEPKSKLFLEKAKAKWNNCDPTTMGIYSDLGAGTGSPYKWTSSDGTTLLTICDSANKLYAVCLP